MKAPAVRLPANPLQASTTLAVLLTQSVSTACTDYAEAPSLVVALEKQKHEDWSRSGSRSSSRGRIRNRNRNRSRSPRRRRRQKTRAGAEEGQREGEVAGLEQDRAQA